MDSQPIATAVEAVKHGRVVSRRLPAESCLPITDSSRNLSQSVKGLGGCYATLRLPSPTRSTLEPVQHAPGSLRIAASQAF